MSVKKSRPSRAPVVRAPDETFATDGAPPPGKARRFFLGLWSGIKLLTGVLVVVAAAGAVAWGAHHYALTTPRFALQNISVEGAARYDAQRIADIAGARRGANLFAIDVVTFEHALLQDPWIAEAKVTRRLPATIEIHVVEREAAASAVIGDRVYLVTRGGEPFKVAEEGDPTDLPVITGVSPENLARDREREVERVARAVEVLRHYEALPAARVDVAQEVHLSDDGRIDLVVGKAGVTLALGKGPWRKKLMMAGRVMGHVSGKGQRAGIVFLDNEAHPERVVVRMK